MNLTPELEVVLLLSDPDLPGSQVNRLRDLLAVEMDWYRVLGLVSAHRTAGTAWINVRDHAIDTRRDMRAGYFLKGLEILYRGQREMARAQLDYDRVLMDELERRGIRCALLKGGAVAHMAYRDPGMRQFNDNDILVDRSRVVEVGRALKELGYVQGSWDFAAGSVRLATREEAVFLAVTSHQTYSYMKPVPESNWLDAHRLDIHLSIDLMTGNRTDEAIDELLGARVLVGDPPIRTLTLIDMLVFCCIHFYKEAIYIGEVRRLKDLVLNKITDLLGLLAAVDQERLAGRVLELGQAAAVYYALYYVDGLYPGRVPSDLMRELRPDSTDYLDQVFDGARPVHHWTSRIPDRFFDASRVAEVSGLGRPAAAGR